MLLPDRHEIEDIGHSRAVTKQITEAELEDDGSNQDTVPADEQTHKQLESRSSGLIIYK